MRHEHTDWFLEYGEGIPDNISNDAIEDVYGTQLTMGSHQTGVDVCGFDS